MIASLSFRTSNFRRLALKERDISQHRDLVSTNRGSRIRTRRGRLLPLLPAATQAAALLLASSVGTLAYDDLATSQVLATPTMPRPAYLQPATDPVFGTEFTRITDPGRQLLGGVRCRPAYCTHRYSISQAWNADQSLLVITNGWIPN